MTAAVPRRAAVVAAESVANRPGLRAVRGRPGREAPVLRAVRVEPERRAEPVHDKTAANFCEWFDFIPREWKEKTDAKTKEDEAREKLRKLLGE